MEKKKKIWASRQKPTTRGINISKGGGGVTWGRLPDCNTNLHNSGAPSPETPGGCEPGILYPVKLYCITSFYWFLERGGSKAGERHQCIAPVTHAFIGCFLYVPWPGIEPPTSVSGWCSNRLSSWAGALEIFQPCQNWGKCTYNPSLRTLLDKCHPAKSWLGKVQLKYWWEVLKIFKVFFFIV